MISYCSHTFSPLTAHQTENPVQGWATCLRSSTLIVASISSGHPLQSPSDQAAQVLQLISFSNHKLTLNFASRAFSVSFPSVWKSVKPNLRSIDWKWLCCVFQIPAKDHTFSFSLCSTPWHGSEPSSASDSIYFIDASALHRLVFNARASARAVLGVIILSVCLSHALIVTKLNDTLQIFLYRTKGQSLCYSDTSSGWWAMPPSLWNLRSKWSTPFEKRRLRQISARPRAFQRAIDGVRTLPLNALKGGSKSDFFVFLSKSQRLIVSSAVNLVRRSVS